MLIDVAPVHRAKVDFTQDAVTWAQLFTIHGDLVKLAKNQKYLCTEYVNNIKASLFVVITHTKREICFSHMAGW
jgi:hypothetical protein